MFALTPNRADKDVISELLRSVRNKHSAFGKFYTILRFFSPRRSDLKAVLDTFGNGLFALPAGTETYTAEISAGANLNSYGATHMIHTEVGDDAGDFQVYAKTTENMKAGAPVIAENKAMNTAYALYRVGVTDSFVISCLWRPRFEVMKDGILTAPSFQDLMAAIGKFMAHQNMPVNASNNTTGRSSRKGPSIHSSTDTLVNPGHAYHSTPTSWRPEASAMCGTREEKGGGFAPSLHLSRGKHSSGCTQCPGGCWHIRVLVVQHGDETLVALRPIRPWTGDAHGAAPVVPVRLSDLGANVSAFPDTDVRSPYTGMEFSDFQCPRHEEKLTVHKDFIAGNAVSPTLPLPGVGTPHMTLTVGGVTYKFPVTYAQHGERMPPGVYVEIPNFAGILRALCIHKGAKCVKLAQLAQHFANHDQAQALAVLNSMADIVLRDPTGGEATFGVQVLPDGKSYVQTSRSVVVSRGSMPGNDTFESQNLPTEEFNKWLEAAIKEYFNTVRPTGSDRAPAGAAGAAAPAAPAAAAMSRSLASIKAGREARRDVPLQLPAAAAPRAPVPPPVPEAAPPAEKPMPPLDTTPVVFHEDGGDMEGVNYGSDAEHLPNLLSSDDEMPDAVVPPSSDEEEGASDMEEEAAPSAAARLPVVFTFGTTGGAVTAKPAPRHKAARKGKGKKGKGKAQHVAGAAKATAPAAAKVGAKRTAAAGPAAEPRSQRPRRACGAPKRLGA